MEANGTAGQQRVSAETGFIHLHSHLQKGECTKRPGLWMLLSSNAMPGQEVLQDLTKPNKRHDVGIGAVACGWT